MINLPKIKYFIFTYDCKDLNDAKYNKLKVIITLQHRNDLRQIHNHYVTTYLQKQNIVNQTLQILNSNFVIHQITLFKQQILIAALSIYDNIHGFVHCLKDFQLLYLVMKNLFCDFIARLLLVPFV